MRRDSTESSLQERLIAAWADSIAERGYSRTTVRHIIARARVSRRAFYRAFEGKEEAFLAIHTAVLEDFARLVGRASAAEADWARGVAAGLSAAMRAMVARPQEALVLIGDPFAAGPRLGYCHDALLKRFVPCLEAGRELSDDMSTPSTLEAGLAGSVIDLVSRRVRAREIQALPALAPSLTEFVLIPYIGPEQARRTAELLPADSSRPAR